MNNIIAVVGNTNSGKTSFSIKLALEQAKRKKNTLVISNDITTPILPVVLPFATLDKEQSFGSLLSDQYISRDSIIKSVVTTKQFKYFALLGYGKGENINSYALYTKDKADEFLIQVRHLFDYIIIDCPYYYTFDSFSAAALQAADWYYCVLSADPKGQEFYYSQQPILNRLEKKEVKVINKYKDLKKALIMPTDAKNSNVMIPYSDELHSQYSSGELLSDIVNDKNYVNALSLCVKGFGEIEAQYEKEVCNG